MGRCGFKEILWLFFMVLPVLTGCLSTKKIEETETPIQDKKNQILDDDTITIIEDSSENDLTETTEQKQNKLFLRSVLLDKKQFFPEKEEVVITFEPSQPCKTKVIICDNRGVEVKTLLNRDMSKTGRNEVSWDGKDSQGNRVQDGIYFYLIEIENPDGRKYLYNPYPSTHGIKIPNISGYYHYDKGVLDYQVPSAAMVMIRAGIKNGGPLLHVIIDWTAHTAGKYSISWDGMEKSGYINVVSHPEHVIMLFGYTLADNSIIVGTPSGKAIQREVNEPEYFVPDLAGDRDIFARHYLTISHAPRFMVEFPDSKEQTEDGLPILRGNVPVKIDLAREDRMALENLRYEIMMYVDTIFLFEDEAGFSPFTYYWDVSSLPEGNHFLTINILSYSGNCGVVTQKVRIMKG